MLFWPLRRKSISFAVILQDEAARKLDEAERRYVEFFIIGRMTAPDMHAFQIALEHEFEHVADAVAEFQQASGRLMSHVKPDDSDKSHQAVLGRYPQVDAAFRRFEEYDLVDSDEAVRRALQARLPRLVRDPVHGKDFYQMATSVLRHS